MSRGTAVLFPTIPLLCAGLLAVSCSTAPGKVPAREDALTIAAGRMSLVREAVKTTEWSHPEALDYYLDFYGLPARGLDVAAKWVQAGGRKLFALTFTPPSPRGRALIVHGYMSHSGHFGAPARVLIAEGYRTTLFDLPGFGLSDGERNGIDDFHSYGDAVAAVVKELSKEDSDAARWERDFDLPTVALGHSTGCSALTDFALRHPEDAAKIDRLVLAAPLVRTTAWDLKRLGAKLVAGKPIAFPRVPAVGRGTIGNQAFLHFLVEEDPLFFPVFDASWLAADARWDSFIGEGRPSSWKGRALILQGEADDVVDRFHNIPVLGRVFPGAEVIAYPGLSHAILNEESGRLAPVLRDLTAFLRR